MAQEPLSNAAQTSYMGRQAATNGDKFTFPSQYESAAPVIVELDAIYAESKV
jgi:hypothetical protein